MSQGYVVVEKKISATGEKWQTVHTVGSSLMATWELLMDSIGASDAQLAEKIAGQTSDRISGVYSITYPSLTPTFLERLVGFERLMLRQPFEVTKLFMHDGVTNARKFKSVALFSGNGWYGENTDTVDVFATGATTLHLIKNASGYSQNNGKMFLRGVLSEGDVTMRGRNLLSWQSNAAQDAYASHLANCLSVSGLQSHFSGDSLFDGLVYAIPHVAPVGVTDGHTSGDLIGYTPVMSVAVDKPTNRQVRRVNRKRKVEVTQSVLDGIPQATLDKLLDAGITLVLSAL